jgi:hypothetical protein
MTMLIKCGQKEIFVNANIIAKVVDNGEDGMQVFYMGNAQQERFTPQTFGDASFMPNFRRQLQADGSFIRLGSGPNYEYVNFSNVRRVVLEGGKETVYFPNDQQTYQGGLVYDAIVERVGKPGNGQQKKASPKLQPARV